jgi:hypothetical protein
MRLTTCLLPLVASLSLAASPVASTVIDFDDLTGAGTVPALYAGIFWGNNFYFYDIPQPPFNPSSGATRIFANYDVFPVGDVGPYPVLVGAGSVFDGLFVAGMSFTTITLKLYSGATEVASVTSGPLSATPTFLATNYAGGISKITLSSSAGNGWWVGDDFTFTTLVPYDVIPEPGTWAMLIVGFGLVGAASRRRARTFA